MRSHLLLLTICALMLSSCSKPVITTSPAYASSYTAPPTNPVNPVNPGSGTITFKVDGVAKSATFSIATLYTSLNSLQIVASVGSTETLNISINKAVAGTYSVSGTDAILSYGTSSNYADSYLGTAGTATITSITGDTVTGTFQFTGTSTQSTSSTKAITEGVFTCGYIKI